MKAKLNTQNVSSDRSLLAKGPLRTLWMFFPHLIFYQCPHYAAVRSTNHMTAIVERAAVTIACDACFEKHKKGIWLKQVTMLIEDISWEFAEDWRCE